MKRIKSYFRKSATKELSIGSPTQPEHQTAVTLNPCGDIAIMQSGKNDEMTKLIDEMIKRMMPEEDRGDAEKVKVAREVAKFANNRQNKQDRTSSQYLKGLFNKQESGAILTVYPLYVGVDILSQSLFSVEKPSKHRITLPPYSIHLGKKFLFKVIQKSTVLNLRCKKVCQHCK